MDNSTYFHKNKIKNDTLKSKFIYSAYSFIGHILDYTWLLPNYFRGTPLFMHCENTLKIKVMEKMLMKVVR